MKVYRVKGTDNKVELLEITNDGIVKVKNLTTNEIIELSEQAFEIAFEPTEYKFIASVSPKAQVQKQEITLADIDSMMENAQIEIVELFGKCTMVAVQFANGFVLTESTTCQDAAYYNKDTNTQNCLDRIKQRITELEGYKFQY
ncbi:Gp49 family protein [Bacillus sp. UNC438CL73TsuS30]|uniref:Gp49 family protein n=1 Tax=Bacillus sp. UNC438CL73TsuS30 TaxID=1340434 RepID=UPI00068C4FFD|nr:Gp49 family protein [Bacillus sp. UNC438CL73TsuS30]